MKLETKIEKLIFQIYPVMMTGRGALLRGNLGGERG